MSTWPNMLDLKSWKTLTKYKTLQISRNHLHPWRWTQIKRRYPILFKNWTTKPKESLSQQVPPPWLLCSQTVACTATRKVKVLVISYLCHRTRSLVTIAAPLSSTIPPSTEITVQILVCTISDCGPRLSLSSTTIESFLNSKRNEKYQI